MDERGIFLGRGRSRWRTLFYATLLPVVATIGFVFEVDTYLPTGTLLFGSLLVGASIVVAWTAGWTGGGAIPGAGAVFTTVLWFFLVPPSVAHLRGLDVATPRYTIPRVSVVLLDTHSELVMGIERGPIVAVWCAGVFGGAAFAAGHLWSKDPPTWLERWRNGNVVGTELELE